MAITNAADVGWGAAITFQSGLFAQITDLSWDGMERSAVDISHMSVTNGWRLYRAGDLKAPGEVTVEINFLTNDLTAYKGMMTAAEEAITVTFPIPVDGGTGAGTWVCKGFTKSMSAAIPMDDRMSASIVLQLSGEPTATDAT